MIRTCLNQSTKNTEAHKGNMEQWAVANEEFQKWQTTGLLAFSKLKLFPLLMLPWLSNYYFSCFSFFFFFTLALHPILCFHLWRKRINAKIFDILSREINFWKKKTYSKCPGFEKVKDGFQYFFFLFFHVLHTCLLKL